MPIQLSYHDRGMKCEFTLMTVGGSSAANAPSTKNANVSKKPAKEAPTDRRTRAQDSAAMPPPSQPAVRSFAQPNTSQRSARPSPPPPKASVDHESLFVSNGDDQERQWEERDYEAEEDEVGWDTSADNVRYNHLTRGDAHTDFRMLSRLGFEGHLLVTRLLQIASQLSPIRIVRKKVVNGGSRQLSEFHRFVFAPLPWIITKHSKIKGGLFDD